MNAEAKPNASASRGACLLALAAVVAGLYFRMYGLAHDLDLKHVYHPDTSKQIQAAKRFLDGTYYQHTGLSDYDGYPLFNSHLVEVAVRIGWPVIASARNVIGLAPAAEWPDVTSLYWVTRLLNVALATFLIWILFCMGRENFSARAGALAAWFLALSPVDVTSAHFETGDTTAAFFGTVCVYFALRMYRSGANSDYIFAALSGLCAFAAKYNAGIAMVAPAAAHVLRQKRWYDVFEAEQVGKALLFAVAAVAGLFLTTPSMFTHPAETIRDTLQFFQHVSSGKRLPDEVRQADLGGRFLFSMHRNGPVLVRILSPSLAAVSILGLGYVLRWNRRMVILYALPIVYFVLGVSLRPLAPPVYHTMMTPALFMICAVALVACFEAPGRWRRPASLAAAVLIAVVLCSLFRMSAAEGFFYRNRDTRRLAENWALENIPSSFGHAENVVTYSFELHGYGNATGGPPGVVWAWNSIRSDEPDNRMFAMKSFSLEDTPLPFFRNPSLELYAWSPALLPGFRMPVFQRVPSRNENEIIFDGGVEFLRSEKMIRLRHDEAAARTLCATQALGRAAVVVRNGATPNLVQLEFAGQHWTLPLHPNEARVLAVDRPKPSFPSSVRHWFYYFKGRAHGGRVVITLATSTRDRGLASFAAGLWADAVPCLAQAARDEKNPVLAAHALVAALLGGVAVPDADQRELDALTEVFRDDWTDARVSQVFGISPWYLDALDYITKDAEGLTVTGADYGGDSAARAGGFIQSRPGEKGMTIALTSLMLDPGAYRLVLDVRSVGARTVPLDLDFSLAKGSAARLDGVKAAVFTRSEHDTSATNDEVFKPVYVPFQVAYGAAESWAVLRETNGAAIAVDTVRIKPDVVASLNALGRVVRLMRGTVAPEDARDPLAYAPLLALGDRHAGREEWDAAFACYTAAARISPGLAEPLARVASIRERLLPGPRDAAREMIGAYLKTVDERALHEVHARFAPGVTLVGYRLSGRRFQRGDAVGLNLYWQIDRADVAIERLGVWVHVKNSERELLMQVDRAMLDDVDLDPAMPERDPFFIGSAIPRKARLGDYEISVGLYDPVAGKRMTVDGKTDLKVHDKGVVLPEEIKVVL